MDIVWLGQAECCDLSLAGGKAASLSILAQRHPVPAGFCITTEAYLRLRSVVGQTSEPESYHPPEFFQMVRDAYLRLCDRCGAADLSVAVRSSAVDEDSAGASFAGRHETFLNVVGPEAVAQAVVRCWASSTSPRVIEYRRQQGLSVADVRIAVLVQQLVLSDVSAVVFSANPMTGDAGEVLVNASWGLGESLVGGTVNPDAYVVRKHDLTVTSRQISGKQRMTVAVPGGTHEVDVPRILQDRPVIADSQAQEMARLAIELERQMGWPVDVECAWHDETLYLLQCRPITAYSADLRNA